MIPATGSVPLDMSRPPKRSRHRAAWLVGLAAVLIVTGMAVARTRSKPGPASLQTSSRAPGTDARPGSPSRGADVAPSFSLATTTGASFSFPTGKPTALLFFAPSCPSCLAPAIALNRLERQLGERIAVLGVDINPTDTAADVRGFLADAGQPRYSFALDPGGRLITAFGIRAQSTVVFADAAGRVVSRLEDESDANVFRAALVKAGLQ